MITQKLNPMRLLFISIMLLGSLSLEAQEIMRSSMGASGASETVTIGEDAYIVHQTVGQQSAIGTYTNENITTRQGFIQPPIKISRIIVEDSNLNAAVYPNPFESTINILFSEEMKENISIVVYDLLGRIVHNTTVKASQELQVDLDSLLDSEYILLVTSGNKQFKANLLKN